MIVENFVIFDYWWNVGVVVDVLLVYFGFIVVLLYENFDGDVFGSVLGFLWVLWMLGKMVFVFMIVLYYLSFLLQLGELIVLLESWLQGVLVVVLDVDNNDFVWVVGVDLIQFDGLVVNVDYYGINLCCVDVGVVDFSKFVVVMMVVDVIDVFGVFWSEVVVILLMLGFNIDIGNFVFDLVSVEIFECVVWLWVYGVCIGWFNDQMW